MTDQSHTPLEHVERIAEIVRNETKTTDSGVVVNSTDVAKAILRSVNSLPSLVKALEEMTQTFKPFTAMPVGAPNSLARADQDHEKAVYTRAMTALSAYRGEEK